jgi:acetylornithine deacetylase
MDALSEIQRRFYKDFPAHAKEAPYNFAASSTFKARTYVLCALFASECRHRRQPTAWSCPEGSLNQIKGEASVSGDMRITPFYPIPEVRQKIEQ